MERLYRIVVKFYIQTAWVLILAQPFLTYLTLDNTYLCLSFLICKWDKQKSSNLLSCCI